MLNRESFPFVIADSHPQRVIASKANFNQDKAMLEVENQQKFSKSDLTQFNGKNGNPAYVGFKGKVYDVTGSDQWVDGDHIGHMAGQDLTEQMEIAPHSEDVMDKMKIVGVLIDS